MGFILNRAQGVVSKGGNISDGEYARVWASPSRNYLQITNDNVGDLLIFIGHPPENITAQRALGNYFVLHGIEQGTGKLGDSVWIPNPVITDDIILVPETPAVDFKVSAISDSKISLETFA
ncbi:hypothetical protein [Vibrio phage VpJYP1]|nr:hypothetical protein [Vibrio phage VpJYP1]